MIAAGHWWPCLEDVLQPCSSYVVNNKWPLGPVSGHSFVSVVVCFPCVCSTARSRSPPDSQSEHVRCCLCYLYTTNIESLLRQMPLEDRSIDEQSVWYGSERVLEVWRSPQPPEMGSKTPLCSKCFFIGNEYLTSLYSLQRTTSVPAIVMSYWCV